MNTSLHYHMGLGQAGGQAAQIGLQLGTASAAALTPTVIGPTVATLLSIAPTTAIPIVGIAIAGISVAIEAILNSGCGQTCIETSQWANQAEPYLQKNIAQYFAIPAPRPKQVQQIAMANFKAIWNQLVQLCSQPSTGTAGQRCISDRQDGSCKWKATTSQYPGGPTLGSCWNWWNGYYWPIANDPNVGNGSPAAVLASPTANVVSTGGGALDLTPIFLLGGALLLFAMFAS